MSIWLYFSMDLIANSEVRSFFLEHTEIPHEMFKNVDVFASEVEKYFSFELAVLKDKFGMGALKTAIRNRDQSEIACQIMRANGELRQNRFKIKIFYF